MMEMLSPVQHIMRTEVCQAASTMNRDVEHRNDPTVCKFAAMLASFELKRAQSLTTTLISDYFHHFTTQK